MIETELLGQLVIIIIALTGVIKTFVPDGYKKTIPLIPLVIGLIFAFVKNIDWVTMLVAVITSIGTYEVGKGGTEEVEETFSWEN